MPDIPRLPSGPDGNDAEYAFHRRTHEELHTGKNEILSGPGIRVSKTTRGRKVQFTGRTGGGKQGFHWAAKRLYKFKSTVAPLVPDTFYTKDEVVIVTPNLRIVTDGTEDPDNPGETIYATPGTWICLKPTKEVDPDSADPDHPDYIPHIPMWPPPGYKTADDDTASHALYADVDTLTPDDPEIFWWPLSFYPGQRTACKEDGTTEQVWTNTTPRVPPDEP